MWIVFICLFNVYELYKLYNNGQSSFLARPVYVHFAFDLQLKQQLIRCINSG